MLAAVGVGFGAHGLGLTYVDAQVVMTGVRVFNNLGGIFGFPIISIITYVDLCWGSLCLDTPT